MRYKLRSSHGGNPSPKVKNKSVKKNPKLKVGRKPNKRLQTTQDRAEPEKQIQSPEAAVDVGKVEATSQEEVFPLKEEVREEALIDVTIEGDDLLQTDPLSLQYNTYEDEIKIDDMEIDLGIPEEEVKIRSSNSRTQEEVTSPINKDLSNLACLKVRNSAYLKDPLLQDESGENHIETTSYIDHATEERICLTTRMITYLGAVSFFEDSDADNTVGNTGETAFLKEKEPAFSFLLVLTKSECPCTLKVEATSSGYVVRKEPCKESQGVQESEEVSSGECSENDSLEDETCLESNQAQDQDLLRLQALPSGIFQDNSRARENSEDNDLLEENQNIPALSKDIISAEYLNQVENVFSHQNSNEKVLSATKEKQLHEESQLNFESEVFGSNYGSDGEENDYSLNFSDDDESPIVKKPQETRVEKKIWKKYYCGFCQTWLGNYSRHIRRVHKEEEQVKKLLELDKLDSNDGIKEKQKLMKKIRYEAMSRYNTKLLSESEPTEDILSKLIFKKRKNGNYENMVVCKYCKNVFAKKSFYLHVHKCDELLKSVGSESCVLSKKCKVRLFSQQFHPSINGVSDEFLEKNVPFINRDTYVLEAYSDKLIMSAVNRFFETHKEKSQRHSISRKIRQGGKLIYMLKKKDSTIKELKDCFCPSKFNLVAKTVWEMCTCNKRNGKKNDALETTLLWVINKAASKLVEDIMMDQKSSEDVRRSSKKEVNKFLALFHKKMKYFKTKINGQHLEKNQTHSQKSSTEQNKNNTNLQTPSSDEQTSKSNPDESWGDSALSTEGKEVLCEIIPKDIERNKTNTKKTTTQNNDKTTIPSKTPQTWSSKADTPESNSNQNLSDHDSNIVDVESVPNANNDIASNMTETTDAVKEPTAPGKSSITKLMGPQREKGSLEKNELGCSEILGSEYATGETFPNSSPLQRKLSTIAESNLDCPLVHNSRKEPNDILHPNETPRNHGNQILQLVRNDAVQDDSTRSFEPSVESNSRFTREASAQGFETQKEYDAEETLVKLSSQVENVHVRCSGCETCGNHDNISGQNESEELHSAGHNDGNSIESSDEPKLKQPHSKFKNTIGVLDSNMLKDLDAFLANSTSSCKSQLIKNIVQTLESTNNLDNLVECMKIQSGSVEFGKELGMNEESLEKESVSTIDTSIIDNPNTNSIKDTEAGTNQVLSDGLAQPVVTTKIMGEHYCIFCKYLVRNFRRHLLQDHKEEEQMVQYFKLFREDKENTHQARSKILEDLCNEGDRIYAEIIIENPAMEYVLTSGLPEKQPSGKRKPSQDAFKMCRRCKNLLSKDEYPDHICFKDEDQSESSDEEDYDKWIPTSKVAKRTPKGASIKGTEGSIKKRWTDEERCIVISEFKEFIKNGTNPGTSRCRDLILKHKVLSGRTNLQLNTMIDNINRGKLKLPKEFQYLQRKRN